MKGIRCAFTGALGQDVELKTSKAGKPWLSFSVAIDMEASEEATTWARVAVFGDLASELAPALKKGTEVYTEGRLKLDSWTGKDGRERTGLSVAANRVEVLGKIGLDLHPRGPTKAQAETHPPLKHPELEGQGRAKEDLPF